MDPGEHLAEAQRLLARAATCDDSERAAAGLPRQAGDWSVERRAADVMAAHAHATIAELMTRPGFGYWVHLPGGWAQWA